jgi:Domain of unknown function (DUF4912)
LNNGIMSDDPRAGRYTISSVPAASSTPRTEPEASDAEELPVYYGEPLLLALARNPHTLFVCWNIDWFNVFGSDLPPDRKAHVRLKAGERERTHAVEPLSGHCSISHLEPGETYLVEIGYYAPAERWSLIASGYEVMMPLEGIDDEAAIEVATAPFHISFERLVELFGGDRSQVVQRLAEFEKRTRTGSAHTEAADQLFHALDLSLAELETAAAIRQTLAKIRPPLRDEIRFCGSSPTR